MPASSPCWMSSTSASNPSRSAHRVYMRSSISAQSWLSVPPAPALIVAIASEASYGPDSSAASSSLLDIGSRASDDRRRELGAHVGVGLVGEQLVHRERIVDTRHQRVVAGRPRPFRRESFEVICWPRAGSSHSEGSEACRSSSAACERLPSTSKELLGGQDALAELPQGFGGLAHVAQSLAATECQLGSARVAAPMTETQPPSGYDAASGRTAPPQVEDRLPNRRCHRRRFRHGLPGQHRRERRPAEDPRRARRRPRRPAVGRDRATC